MIAVRVNGGRLHVESPVVKPRRGKVTRCGQSLRPPATVEVILEPELVPADERCLKCWPGSARKPADGHVASDP